MKEKKGFIAISLLYAFFLVFLMLMVAILATATQNRVLVGALKDNIRTSISTTQNDTLLFDTIKLNQPYEVGEKALFGGETWFVIENSEASDPTVKIVLARALSEEELKKNLDVTKLGEEGVGVQYDPSELSDVYDFVNDKYMIRGCRMLTNVADGINISSKICYRFTEARFDSQYSAPVFGDNYIPQMVAAKWYNTHPMLRLLTSRVKPSTIGSATNQYVRLPFESEVINLVNGHETYNDENNWYEDWVRNIYPFHLTDGLGARTIKIATLQNMTDAKYTSIEVPSYTGALIRPVLEVKKA